MNLQTVLARMPLIAILRGITPKDSVAVAQALVDEGFLCIEIPTNSPDYSTSITHVHAAFGDRCLIGAGTVVNHTHLDALVRTGGILMVSPNVNVDLIRAAKSRGLVCAPGCFTPTEAYAAIEAGADALKFFPADVLTPAGLRGIKTILPPSIPVMAVGGITLDNLAAYRHAGVDGVGLGSCLYKPGDTAAVVTARARAFVKAWNKSPSA